MTRFLASLALLLMLAVPALAQNRPLDAPRAAGTVGERFDGFATVRAPNAAPGIKTLVDQANAERAALYKQRAASDGASADAVGKIYAKQIMESAPAGTWFLQESGQWTQKK